MTDWDELFKFRANEKRLSLWRINFINFLFISFLFIAFYVYYRLNLDIFFHFFSNKGKFYENIYFKCVSTDFQLFNFKIQYKYYLLLFLILDIPDIPENIKNLRALQVADFSSNPIPRSINYSLFYFSLWKMFKFSFKILFLLKILIKDLKKRQIILNRLPAGFVQLRNLTVLGLNDMSLTNLPPDFGR